MATCLRQLYYLLYKNTIFKYRYKRQAIAEVLVIFFLPALLAVIWKITTQGNYDVIPSSEQMKHNAGEIPGGKRQHLAYVTNVNASEFLFFLWFYSLTLLICQER